MSIAWFLFGLNIFVNFIIDTLYLYIIIFIILHPPIINFKYFIFSVKISINFYGKLIFACEITILPS